MLCGPWLAMASACMPSCCFTCKACNRALSTARSASTRLPIPVFSVSCNLVTKILCAESFFADEPSRASAALTRVIELVSRTSAEEAALWVARLVEFVMTILAPEMERFSEISVIVFWASASARKAMPLGSELSRILAPSNSAFRRIELI